MKNIEKIVFTAKGIKEVKTKLNPKISLELNVEKFRQNMLAKHDLLFTKTQHSVGVFYKVEND
jgi:hypothetical protein